MSTTVSALQAHNLSLSPSPLRFGSFISHALGQSFANRLSLLSPRTEDKTARVGRQTTIEKSLIHTNTRYLLPSNEGVLLKHPSGKMKKSFGDRSFSVAAPTLWNALPVSLRSIKCISTLNLLNLKTYLFKLAFNIS